MKGLIWKGLSAINSVVIAQKSKVMRVSVIKMQQEQYYEGIPECLSTCETENTQIADLMKRM